MSGIEEMPMRMVNYAMKLKVAQSPIEDDPVPSGCDRLLGVDSVKQLIMIIDPMVGYKINLYKKINLKKERTSLHRKRATSLIGLESRAD